MAIEKVGHLYRCAKEPIFMASSYMVQSFLTGYGKKYNLEPSQKSYMLSQQTVNTCR
jgi:hypothetical protein